MGYEAATSRYMSRSLDDSGVDVWGNFPYGIQCKATVKTPSIHDLLTTTAADVIFWRRIVKKGKQFYKDGEYAIIELDKFYELVNKAEKK